MLSPLAETRSPCPGPGRPECDPSSACIKGVPDEVSAFFQSDLPGSLEM